MDSKYIETRQNKNQLKNNDKKTNKQTKQKQERKQAHRYSLEREFRNVQNVRNVFS